MRVPALADLEDLAVEVDRSGQPDVISILAWEGNDTVRVTWDASRGTARMVWSKEFQTHLVADRSEVSEIDVRRLDDEHVEISVIWGAPGEQQELVAHVMDPIDMTDVPLDTE